MTFLRTLCIASVFAFSIPVAAVAQDDWAIEFSMEQVEAYYALYGPSRLVQAQIVLAQGGHYSGPFDGQWGPGTRAAFADVLQTLIAINGGPEFVMIRTPDDVPSLTDWVGSAILAQGGFQEFPD